MKTAFALFALLLTLLTGGAYAQTTTDVNSTNQAGATALSVIQGAQASPTIGFPSAANTSQTPLFQVQPPPYVLFGTLVDTMAKVSGPITIDGADQLTQVNFEQGDAKVAFAPGPAFARFKTGSYATCGQWRNSPAPCRDVSSQLSATFVPGLKDAHVSYLGAAMFMSKEGTVVLPTAAMQAVRDAINHSSGRNLKSILLVPVPRGYGIMVGIRNEGSGNGIALSLGKFLGTLFAGIGPSHSSQDGTTMPTGWWSQQYLVLTEDENAVPFSINFAPPPETKVPVAATEPDPKAEIAAARLAALNASQKMLKEAEAREAKYVALLQERTEQPPRRIIRSVTRTAVTKECPCAKR